MVDAVFRSIWSFSMLAERYSRKENECSKSHIVDYRHEVSCRLVWWIPGHLQAHPHTNKKIPPGLPIHSIMVWHSRSFLVHPPWFGLDEWGVVSTRQHCIRYETDWKYITSKQVKYIIHKIYEYLDYKQPGSSRGIAQTKAAILHAMTKNAKSKFCWTGALDSSGLFFIWP